MKKNSEEAAGVRSVENLHHFLCPHCKKWWTIADASATRKKWFCPWCGIESSFRLKKTA